jgi:hypothetical protein
MHSVATPFCLPWRCSAWISVTMMRAPLAPMGWPSAQAPPLYVDLLVRHLEIGHERHGHHGEGFVHFPQVDVVHAPAGLLQRLLRGADRGPW